MYTYKLVKVKEFFLTFYIDNGFFHGKATNKGVRYNLELDRLEMSTD